MMQRVLHSVLQRVLQRVLQCVLQREKCTKCHMTVELTLKGVVCVAACVAACVANGCADKSMRTARLFCIQYILWRADCSDFVYDFGEFLLTFETWYGVASISRLLNIICLFCRISSLL